MALMQLLRPAGTAAESERLAAQLAKHDAATVAAVGDIEALRHELAEAYRELAVSGADAAMGGVLGPPRPTDEKVRHVQERLDQAEAAAQRQIAVGAELRRRHAAAQLAEAEGVLVASAAEAVKRYSAYRLAGLALLQLREQYIDALAKHDAARLHPALPKPPGAYRTASLAVALDGRELVEGLPVEDFSQWAE